MITNEQFVRLMDKYQGTFIQWHLHLKKYISVDRESFFSEFQMILFKTMLQFDVKKATADNARFERYFMSSLRKMCNTILRRASSQKRQADKNNVSFSLKNHDLRDNSADHGQMNLIVEDIIHKHVSGEDRDVLQMIMAGFRSSEICRQLNIDHSVYRRCLRRIRCNNGLAEAVSRI